MEFLLEHSKDYTNATGRDLAKLRGAKRTILQMLRKACEVHLVELTKSLEPSHLGVAFCNECKEYCAINDRRLGDPDFDSVIALKALYKDVKTINTKFGFVNTGLPAEFKELLEEEMLPTEGHVPRGTRREQSCEPIYESDEVVKGSGSNEVEVVAN
ncbi:MAG: hypothetical protein M1822_009629 [Bathelium mastoideum]|nr:MAG: hypothetical protein M1822_009629 [Bathelium mastoideum]